MSGPIRYYCPTCGNEDTGTFQLGAERKKVHCTKCWSRWGIESNWHPDYYPGVQSDLATQKYIAKALRDVKKMQASLDDMEIKLEAMRG